MVSTNISPNNKIDDPLYNSGVIKIFVEYLQKHYPDLNIDSILKYAEMTKYEVEDQGHWFNQRQVDRFHQILVKKTWNQNVAREAGRYATIEKFRMLKQKFVEDGVMLG